MSIIILGRENKKIYHFTEKKAVFSKKIFFFACSKQLVSVLILK